MTGQSGEELLDGPSAIRLVIPGNALRLSELMGQYGTGAVVCDMHNGQASAGRCCLA